MILEPVGERSAYCAALGGHIAALEDEPRVKAWISGVGERQRQGNLP
jgi:hypothetical protein